eukprot:TRINITY_DN7016_c0_g2_i4.p1 TRINITY_DN7016_c0_g2~~TRINITY_DN7016_c0_g2_i4.p1  ORF type:complete len:134 (-),score=10.46 TRINITY_DN7016_c0_g2_i4:91-492(-)
MNHEPAKKVKSEYEIGTNPKLSERALIGPLNRRQRSFPRLDGSPGILMFWSKSSPDTLESPVHQLVLLLDPPSSQTGPGLCVGVRAPRWLHLGAVVLTFAVLDAFDLVVDLEILPLDLLDPCLLYTSPSPRDS